MHELCAGTDEDAAVGGYLGLGSPRIHGDDPHSSAVPAVLVLFVRAALDDVPAEDIDLIRCQLRIVPDHGVGVGGNRKEAGTARSSEQRDRIGSKIQVGVEVVVRA